MCTIPLEEYEKLQNELMKYREKAFHLERIFYDYKLDEFVDSIDLKTIVRTHDLETDRIVITGKVKKYESIS